MEELKMQTQYDANTASGDAAKAKHTEPKHPNTPADPTRLNDLVSGSQPAQGRFLNPDDVLYTTEGRTLYLE